MRDTQHVQFESNAPSLFSLSMDTFHYGGGGLNFRETIKMVLESIFKKVPFEKIHKKKAVAAKISKTIDYSEECYLMFRFNQNIKPEAI